jgi:hypothetical protein
MRCLPGARPNTAFQSDPRRPALSKIVGILAVRCDLSVLVIGAGG